MLVLANLRGSTQRVSESFIQSETSASTHEFSESNRASKYVMLLGNFGDEHRGLSPVLEAGFRHQLVLIPPTEQAKYAQLTVTRFYSSLHDLVTRPTST